MTPKPISQQNLRINCLAVFDDCYVWEDKKYSPSEFGNLFIEKIKQLRAKDETAAGLVEALKLAYRWLDVTGPSIDETLDDVVTKIKQALSAFEKLNKEV